MTTPPSRDGHAVPADLEAQAWNWLRLLRSGDARELDAKRFRRWVHSSPAHQAAYNAVKFRWDALEPPARELLQRKPEAVPRPRRRVGSAYGRRAFLGAAIGAAAAAGVAVVHPPLGWWPAIDEWGADDRTAAGEQRTLALADGIDVTLNTRTSVRRRTSGGQAVGLELIAGEAAIDLGAGRAFAVIAGAGRSTAEWGRFEVRHVDGKACVTCIEGAVRVEHPAGTRVLQARQQVRYDAVAVGSVASVEPAAATAWREGVLVFSQTPLADVIDEINRYRTGRVMLMNDRVRNRPVSGRFAIVELDMALWQLQESFDLRARTLPAGVLILS
ncbi:FecR family protein [Pseudothauera rhizosphaerae]|uniref:DUF4880 domain-containing protein n=1 Tax=Pseudothauera rhizosphaerae TaxID=2565932 RepID=A0A4S4ALM0_9RHOO|nr:FecR domain-containing protein [Pseudothauera rhizosphaerae]THF60440.1 DUF4880 domain-containing protein [Pseudothauera rhizosphaerae]